MTQFTQFPFHWFLQEKTIPELERMIKNEEYIFTIPRRGTYKLTQEKPRMFSVATYKDKTNKYWYIHRIK